MNAPISLRTYIFIDASKSEKGSVPFSCRNPRSSSNGLANASPCHPCYLLAKLIIPQRRTALHASAYRMKFLSLQCTPEQFSIAKLPFSGIVA